MLETKKKIGNVRDLFSQKKRSIRKNPKETLM